MDAIVLALTLANAALVIANVSCFLAGLALGVSVQTWRYRRNGGGAS